MRNKLHEQFSKELLAMGVKKKNVPKLISLIVNNARRIKSEQDQKMIEFMVRADQKNDPLWYLARINDK